MDIPLFQVDAFSAVAFKGNPAAVCILEKPIPDDLMMSIAEENNLSETAFASPYKNGFNLRWFTPTTEVDLCGHATLATAHTLWSEKIVSLDSEIIFYTKSGELNIRKSEGWIHMTFPSFKTEAVQYPEEIKSALGGLEATYAGLSNSFYLIEIDSVGALKEVKPDFNSLQNMKPVFLTARTGPGSMYDFISRVFAPSIGINEDPVTGAAHCVLGPYWSKRLNKDKLFAYQASKRGGELKVEVLSEKVILSGQAITVLRGKLSV